MKKVLAAALGTVLCCSGAFAFDVSPTQINTGKKHNKKVQVKAEFIRKIFATKSMADGIELLSVTDEGDRLSSVRGILSSPLAGDPVEAAKNYIEENSDLFNLPARRDVEYLRLVRNDRSGDVSHVAYQMVIDGVPVHEAVVEVHINRDGVVTLANGSLPKIDEIDNQIVLSKYQAIGAAKDALKADKFRAIPDAQVQIVAGDNGRARMAYVAKLAVEKPLGDWNVIVDAENGDIIYMNNEMNFKTGLGAVYVTNPLKCEVTQEPLEHLTTNTLTGLYCTIDNEDGPESVNENDVHVYEPDNTHFDEVGMYNYVTSIHGFFKNLGHSALDKPMKAIVHLGTDYDNAYFSPWEGALAFGDGSKFNNLAREASVAYHEYSHAVLNSITYLAYSGESGAINEGQADYFACSHTNDSMLGEWVVAKMGKPFLRNVENDLVYPKDIQGEVHADGKIWGAVLWDIRKAIGKEDADMLIYKSHFYLNGSKPKFIDAYNALVTADKNVFAGKHLNELEQVMMKRGVVAASYNGAVMTAEDLKTMKRFMEVHNED
jgi:Zn-dependent metalloprotease